MAARFDARSHQVIGSAVPIEKGINQLGVTGAVQFAAADSGTLVYVPGTSTRFPLRTLTWIDRKGVERPISAEPRTYSYPRLSPDGTRIALDVAEENRDIWVWHLARETLTRLTSDPGIDQFPAWMSDSKHLLFGSTRANGVSNLYRQLADGTQNAERLLESPDDRFPTAVTPDGTRAVLATGGQGDLMLVQLDEPRQVEWLTQTPFSERNGTFPLMGAGWPIRPTTPGSTRFTSDRSPRQIRTDGRSRPVVDCNPSGQGPDGSCSFGR